MRVCRFRHADKQHVGFYDEPSIVPIDAAAAAYRQRTGSAAGVPGDQLLALLPGGEAHEAAGKLLAWLESHSDVASRISVATADVELLIPVARPNKLLLLAGNYARHIEEGGGVAAERAETFPYVFMKPPSTTLTDPGKPVRLPSASPDHCDWELELAVVIGRTCKAVSEKDALGYVAGYTIVNDISDRQFRPNPNRKPREKDSFFDWLHGKWHDSFCPCGPCVTSADTITDPQSLKLQLRVNGELKQDSNTANQIFPVAAVIEFISRFVTLEPGDLISTGTPSGVGHSSGTYLNPDDKLEASISSIGTLHSTVEGP